MRIRPTRNRRNTDPNHGREERLEILPESTEKTYERGGKGVLGSRRDDVAVECIRPAEEHGD